MNTLYYCSVITKAMDVMFGYYFGFIAGLFIVCLW